MWDSISNSPSKVICARRKRGSVEMETPLRLLLVEDMPAEAELVVREFARYGTACDWRRVDTEPEFIHEIATLRPHVIVSDFSLPRFDGLSALRAAQTHAPEVPF